MTVFDPDGMGQDFAYTIGLCERDLPELRVWARPTDGLDPGEDFALSPRDCAFLLDGWAEELLRGELTAGSLRSLPLDAGAASAVFTAQDPVPARELDALVVDDRAAVITMRWEVQRAPIGPLLTLTPEQERSHDDLAAAMLSRLGPLPAPAEAASDVDTLGPDGVVARARASLLAGVRDEALGDFMIAVLDEQEELTVTHALAPVSAAAQPVGLTAQVRAASELAGAVLDTITGPDRSSRRWAALITGLAGPLTAAEFPLVSDDLVDALHHDLSVTLAADVLGRTVRNGSGSPSTNAGCRARGTSAAGQPRRISRACSMSSCSRCGSRAPASFRSSPSSRWRWSAGCGAGAPATTSYVIAPDGGADDAVGGRDDITSLGGEVKVRRALRERRARLPVWGSRTQ